jgi:hypothetical protein
MTMKTLTMSSVAEGEIQSTETPLMMMKILTTKKVEGDKTGTLWY